MVNAPIQGLRISLKLADSLDTIAILRNLDLDISDLDRIRNISDAGVEQSDIQTLSGLTSDIDKGLVAIYNETLAYDTITSTFNDGRRIINNNLNVAGQIIAPSFKFKRVNFERLYNAVIPTNVTGVGTGATFNVVRTVGSTGYTVSLNTGGTGYSITAGQNTIRILGTQVGGITTANDITITITGVTAGAITTFTIPAAGALGNTPVLYGDPNATVDFSTSRISAWSSFTSPTDSVFYGGDVIISSPPLPGARSSLELSSLQFNGAIKAKLYESQIPTHKIRAQIDGINYDLFAMKGIPLKFTGFFRSLPVGSFSISFNAIPSTLNTTGIIRPTWILRNGINETIFQNRFTGNGINRTSAISFSDSTDNEREIEFYYPVDNITGITLDNAKIYAVPNIKLNNLTTLNIVNGDLIEIPDLKTLYPNLVSLNLSNNDLSRSDTVALKTFSPAVTNRISTNIRNINLNEGVYSGDCTGSLSTFNSLTSFTAYSFNSTRKMTGTSPAIGPNLLIYDVGFNRFTSIHPSVLTSNNIREINIRGNGLTIPNAVNTNPVVDTSPLTSIQRFTTGGNSHQIINMTGKQTLLDYNTSDMNFSGDRIGTNMISQCSNLTQFYIHNTNVTGALPNFSSNSKLSLFYSWNTAWEDANADYSIAEDTFGGPTEAVRSSLTYFNLQSGNLRKPIHPKAFLDMIALNTLVVVSYGLGITGDYPISLNDCFSLTTLYLNNNKLSGDLNTITSFTNNKALSLVNLSNNDFTGVFPPLDLPNLTNLNIRSNLFTNLGLFKCLNLTYFNAGNNLLTEVPIFTNMPRVQEVYLNNNPGITYTSQRLIPATSLRILDISNCGLNTGDIDTILQDLNINYNTTPRANVTINLTSNAPPSASEEIVSIINRLRRVGWTLGLDT